MFLENGHRHILIAMHNNQCNPNRLQNVTSVNKKISLQALTLESFNIFRYNNISGVVWLFFSVAIFAQTIFFSSLWFLERLFQQYLLLSIVHAFCYIIIVNAKNHWNIKQWRKKKLMANKSEMKRPNANTFSRKKVECLRNKWRNKKPK